MSEFVIAGRDASGQPVYEEVLNQQEIIERLKSRVEWQEFSDRFDTSSESNNKLLGMLFVEKLGDDPGIEDYRRLLKNIIRSGGVARLSTIKDSSGNVLLEAGQYEFELKEVVPEPTPEPEVPRDRNGNPLTSSQLQWREFAIWANDPSTSSETIRQRRLTDRSFAEFYRRSLEREATETPSTQFELAGQSPVKAKSAITPELIAFAEEYRKTPTQEVRKRRNPTFNLNAQQYERNFQAALAAGLL